MRLSHAIAASLVLHLVAVWMLSSGRIYPEPQASRSSQRAPFELRLTAPLRAAASADAPVRIAADPSPQHAADGYFSPSEVEQRAVPLSVEPLIIPERAYIERRKGKVKLRAYIDEAGRVHRVLILSAEPAGFFEQAAINAVAASVFSPARRGGIPVKTYKELEIDIDPYESISVP